MGKKIFIIVALFLVSSLSAWGFDQEMSESEDLMLKQKYAVLDQLNVEELKNMSSESFNSIRNLFNEYFSYTRDKKNRERMETLLPNIPKKIKGFGDEAKRRDIEKKSKIRKNHTEQNYERFLREIKDIKDENTINQKMELYRKENSAPYEEEKEFIKYILSL